jgi:hypothetical protein
MFQIEKGFRFSDPAWCEAIMGVIRAKGIKVLFLDSLLSCLGIKNENDNAELAAVLDVVRHRFVAEGLSVVFIHHPAKNQEGGNGLRGAGDILGKMDVHICLTKNTEDKRKVAVSYEKMRVEDESLLSNFEIRLAGDGGIRQLHYRYLGVTKTKTDEMVGKIRSAMAGIGEGQTREAVASSVGTDIKNGTFVRSWDKLKKEGSIYQGIDKKFYLKNCKPEGLHQPVDKSPEVPF